MTQIEPSQITGRPRRTKYSNCVVLVGAVVAVAIVGMVFVVVVVVTVVFSARCGLVKYAASSGFQPKGLGWGRCGAKEGVTVA